MYQPDIDTAARTIAMKMLAIPCACRECGEPWSDQVAKSFLSGARCKCVKCGWYGNWRAGSILNGRHIDAAQFIVLFSAFSLFRAPTYHEFKLVADRTALSVDYVRYWHQIIIQFLSDAQI
jgi:predicted RNA-binding Zn-ribbon protein involved in translation (DUF1610 family)